VNTLSTRSTALAFALALAGLALPSLAAADDKNGYVVLKGGVYFPTATNVIGALNQVNLGTFPTSGDVELGVGTSFGILGIQLAAGYLWTAKNEANGSIAVGGVPVTGVLQLRFPIFFVVPYIEAGVGFYTNTAKLTVGTSISTTKVAFMAPLGGGVDLLLGPFLAGVEARYLYINPTSYTWGTFPVSTLNMQGVVLTGNLGYRF